MPIKNGLHLLQCNRMQLYFITESCSFLKFKHKTLFSLERFEILTIEVFLLIELHNIVA